MRSRSNVVVPLVGLKTEGRNTINPYENATSEAPDRFSQTQGKGAGLNDMLKTNNFLVDTPGQNKEPDKYSAMRMNSLADSVSRQDSIGNESPDAHFYDPAKFQGMVPRASLFNPTPKVQIDEENEDSDR